MATMISQNGQPISSGPQDVFVVTHPLAKDFNFTTSGNLDTIAMTVKAGGLSSYESPTTDIILYLCRSNPGIMLDIGANTGLFALAAASVNDVMRVVAFEPLDSVRSLLNANISTNPELTHRVAVESLGLSDSEGSFSFYETINNMGLITTSSSLEKSHAIEVGEFREQVVHTISLDEWVTRNSRGAITFMKIDVEGHEHAVIRGGRKTIADHRPFITIEVLGSSSIKGIDNFLIESDYVSLAMAPGELRYGQKVRFHADAWNHLLCPRERAGDLLPLCRKLGLSISCDD